MDQKAPIIIIITELWPKKCCMWQRSGWFFFCKQLMEIDPHSDLCILTEWGDEDTLRKRKSQIYNRYWQERSWYAATNIHYYPYLDCSIFKSSSWIGQKYSKSHGIHYKMHVVDAGNIASTNTHTHTQRHKGNSLSLWPISYQHSCLSFFAHLYNLLPIIIPIVTKHA